MRRRSSRQRHGCSFAENGEHLELIGPCVQDGAIHATIPDESLDYGVIGERFLDIQLVAYSAGYLVENIAHVEFVE